MSSESNSIEIYYTEIPNGGIWNDIRLNFRKMAACCTGAEGCNMPEHTSVTTDPAQGLTVDILPE